jgi:DNA (cytosine-5)-methyltransferase 1
MPDSKDPCSLPLDKSARNTRSLPGLFERKVNRNGFYGLIPREQISSVINAEIKSETLPGIFETIDLLLNGEVLDLIIGGPPCQAYSIVGRSRDKNGMIGDQRNYLYKLYAEFLARFKPRFFVFENVTGILSAKDIDGGRYFDNMIRLFEDVGYWTEFRTLSANDYGVLQQRKRLILVGNRDMKVGFSPDPKLWKSSVVVQEVLGDLPAVKAGEGSNFAYSIEGILWKLSVCCRDPHRGRPHTERDLEIYRIAAKRWNTSRRRLDYSSLPAHLKTHANQTDFGDRYNVVAGDLPMSQTVVAHIAKDGHYYIHPDIEQNRSSTLTMAARASFCCTPI